MYSDKITKPTLVISREKVEKNIDKMIEKASVSGAILRPHFKTHQSAETGEFFRQKGINKITVSSVDMANFFARHGWNDITIAFPVNIREIKEINRLSGLIKLNLLVESRYVAEFLRDEINNNINIFIKIDTGYHRTGLTPYNPEIHEIIKIAETTNKLCFSGFLTHSGNTYNAKGKQEIINITGSVKEQLKLLKIKYHQKYPNLVISYGDTPSCSIADNCKGFDEIRPGNFVYYDVMQYHIGSCDIENIAVAAACPVISVHPERGEIVVYGGAIHLSKESIEAENGFKLFGYVVNFTENGWTNPVEGAYVKALSQEHGIIRMPIKHLKNYKPGDLIGILPVHSCLTANLLKQQIFI